MLFLAVFCGFLAEYQLEHKIEKDRAKELAKSFYQELKNDSATAVIKVQNRIKQEEAIKYLIKYFKDSSLTNISKDFAINFVYGVNFRTPAFFFQFLFCRVLLHQINFQLRSSNLKSCPG